MRRKIIIRTPNDNIYEFYAKEVMTHMSFIEGETIAILVDERYEVIRNGSEILKEEDSE